MLTLCILLLPGAWRIARGRDGGLVFRIVLAVVALGLLVAPFLLWMPLQTQRNAHWLALMLPLQLALAAALHARAGPHARGSGEAAAAQT